MLIQTFITNYFEKKNVELYEKKNKKNKVYGFNCETNSWHCIKCGDNIGQHNTRQLCGKYYCYNM